jgi:peptide/nickel transport system permease protein
MGGRFQAETFRNKSSLCFLGRLTDSIYFVCHLAAIVAPYDPTINNLSLRHQPPGYVDGDGRIRLLGTDHLGRDVWSRIVWGARASMTVGYVGLLLGGLVGVTLG